MTAQQPPVWIGGESHTSEDLRRSLGILSGPGVAGSADMAVTEKSGTPNMSVDVATGRAVILGSDATYQGSYTVDNRGTRNVTIATADGSNPRKDLIVARVRDSAYAGADDDWDIVAVTGTPAAVPTEPSAPANSLTLAMVDVVAGATSITNAKITNRRTLARPWNTAWGEIARSVYTSNVTGITASTPVVNDMAVSFINGRRVKLSGFCRIQQTASGSSGVDTLLIHRVDPYTEFAVTAQQQVASNAFRTHVIPGVPLTVSATETATLRMVIAATVSVSALATSSKPNWMLAEDIGPA